MVTEHSAERSITLTIFTPAYNRARLLPRLFDSIREQQGAEQSAEWLIIDDGSTDDTESVVAGFASEAPGLVRYVRVPNGGKHRAVNLAAKMARGRWVMIVDSDDYVAEGAVRRLLDTIERVDGNASLGLIRGHRTDVNGVRRRFRVKSNPGLHADWASAQSTFDTAELIRRSALVLHPFPEWPGERFMSEAWLWHRLDSTHRTLFADDVWIVCEYQNDGLTANSRRVRANSPRSAMAVYEEQLRSPLPLKALARARINWWRYRFHASLVEKDNRWLPPGLAFAPLGWAIFMQDRFLLRRRRRRTHESAHWEM